MKRYATMPWMAVGLWFGTVTAYAVTCDSAAIPVANPDAVYVSDNGMGSVTDTRTGLMWKKCSEGQIWNGSACAGKWRTYTWSEALGLGVKDRTGNFSDWRLPNIKELRTLVEECRVDPAINDSLFPGTPSAYFWSGSPHLIYHSDNTWYVSFYDGFPAFDNRRFNFSVRLVRGGQSFDSLASPPTSSVR